MEFGGVLRKMRREAGMSQEELAEELHISRSNVSRLETNNLELKAADLLRWANATETQDLLIATMCSIDISIVQQILESSTTVINMILGGII